MGQACRRGNQRDVCRAAQAIPATKKSKQGATAADDDDEDDDGTPKYEETLIPEKWWAKLADDHSKIVAKDNLVVLFGSRYVNEVMVHGKAATSTSKFINVPVGAVRKPRCLDHPSLCVDGALLVYCQQGTYDTCVFSSMASALYFAGAKGAANLIQNKAEGTAGCNVQGMFHRLQEQVF
jgi:hypothetical protein